MGTEIGLMGRLTETQKNEVKRLIDAALKAHEESCHAGPTLEEPEALDTPGNTDEEQAEVPEAGEGAEKLCPECGTPNLLGELCRRCNGSDAEEAQ